MFLYKLNSSLFSVFANLDETCTRIKIKATVAKFGTSLFDLAAENAYSILDERLPHYIKEVSATLINLSQYHPPSFFKKLFSLNNSFCSHEELYSVASQVQEKWVKTAKRSSPKDNSMMMRTAKSHSNPQSYVPARKRFISEKQSQSFDSQTTSYQQELHHDPSLSHIPHSHQSLTAAPYLSREYEASRQAHHFQQLQSQDAQLENSRYHQSLQMQVNQLGQPHVQMNCLPSYHTPAHIPQSQLFPASGHLYNQESAHAHHSFNNQTNTIPQQSFQTHQNQQMYSNTAAQLSGGGNRFSFGMLPNYDHTKTFLPNIDSSPDTGYSTSGNFESPK